MKRLTLVLTIAALSLSGYLCYRSYHHYQDAARESRFAQQNRRQADAQLAAARQTADPDDREFLVARARGQAADVATIERYAGQAWHRARRWISLAFGAFGLTLGLGWLSFRPRRGAQAFRLPAASTRLPCLSTDAPAASLRRTVH